MTADGLLAELDASQRAAVTSPAATLAILAPAGSGKTRVLTRRIAWRVRDDACAARHVLAVTFTRKAAGELVDRLRRLGAGEVTAGTFHALALAQLRSRATDQGRPQPAVLERKAAILAPLLGGRGAGTALAVSELAAEIEWAKARMVRPDAYVEAATAAARPLPRPGDVIAELYARYEAEKRRRRVLDFDDLLWWCVRALHDDPDFAAAQRWRFRHLFVDEFQDASPLQVELLRAWLGDRADLCVVGDVAQAIYRFAGADHRYLAEFPRHFPGAEVVELRTTYRSTPQVVAVAHAALGPESQVTRVPARAVRSAGPAPSFTEYPDDAAEAAAVADAMWRAYTRGVPWHRMAVLFRINAQSARFEHALAARAVPFRVSDGGRFAERPAVRVLLDELRALERTAPHRPFADHLADLAARAGDEDEVDAEVVTEVEVATDVTADGAAGPPGERAAHLDALVRLGREYLAAEGGRGSVAGFAAWIELATRSETHGERGTELATFHRAKGLEWHTVWVTGLERGLVPISRAGTADAVAEEARLLHVALSRAEHALHCSWARERSFGGRPARRQPSPWLPRLVAAATATGGEDRPADGRRAIAEVRATLAAADPPPRRQRARRR